MARIALLLAATLLVAACSNMVETKSGLRYTDVELGSGQAAVDGMTVLCHYALWFSDSGGITKKELVQSSEDYGEPFQCRIGHGLIPGWSEGMLGMKEGGLRRIFVPWRLGYGETGAPSLGIPGKQNLIFEIKFIQAL
jgi:FKBP-type peptidyl-prolyl cis-trans isomerase